MTLRRATGTPSRRETLVGLVGLGGAAVLGARSRPALAQSGGASAKPLEYYSDYFSFVGRDAKGHVYLAHDNNRGRDGDTYQANHFIAMYDDATGWVDVKGNTLYPNTGNVLEAIPESDFFAFRGRPASGVVMTGKATAMRMTVEPLSQVQRRQNADGVFWIGAAPAVLEWSGRRIPGRVIFEYLQRTNFNYITSNIARSWQNFNGLYLLTEDGHDFYMHSHERTSGSDLTGRLVGIATWGEAAPVSKLDFRIVETAAVPYRSYRWPIAWRVGFEHAGRADDLELFTAERQLRADWTTGGFAMAVANGSFGLRTAPAG